MVLSYKDFTKMGEKTKSENAPVSTQNMISYFYLADDGDEAVVRFNVSSEEDLQVYPVHSIEVNGKRRMIACLRESLNDPTEKCPLCTGGQKLYFKSYIQMISYTPDETGMVAKPVVWERPASFVETLKEYLDNYGDLREELFKIVRKGKKGDQGTTYVIIPLGSKSMVYNAATCPADFSEFENYSVLGRAVMQRSKEDITTFVETGSFPAPAARQKPEQSSSIPEYLKKDAESFELTQKDVEDTQREVAQRTYQTETPTQQKPGPRRYNF